MRKRFRGISLLIFCALAVSALTGCKSIDDDPAKKSEVLKRVKQEVPSEKYEYLSMTRDESSRPKVDEYLFRSKERDITFTAVSTLAPFGIDGGTIGYNDSIRVTYPDSVHELYRSRIDKVLADISESERDRYSYDSFDDIDPIVRTLIKADKIYREELAYNSEEWLSEHPVCTVSLNYRWNDGEEDKHYQVHRVNIDGSLDYDKLYKRFSYEHAKAAKKEIIVDETIPEEQLARVHRDMLDIYINFNEVSDSAYEDAKSRRLINNCADYYCCQYYYPWDCYVILLNTGLTGDDYAPQLMENYTEALGCPCHVKYNKGEITWVTERAEWKIKTKWGRDHEMTDFGIYKDGDRVDVKYITYRDEMSVARATYTVGISVDDFADIFDLDVYIDEDSNMISFFKKYDF